MTSGLKSQGTAPALPAALRLAVAEAYRPAGRWAYHFALGKLGGDPVFAGLLQRGLLPSHGHLLDLGCGQGLWATLLAVLDAQPANASGASTPAPAAWPAGWAPAPRGLRVSGIEMHAPDVARLRAAMASLGCPHTVLQGDLRHCALPRADVVLLQDVLHYLDAASQRALLERVRACLPAGGLLLLRVGNRASGLRFAMSRWVDSVVCLARNGRWPTLHGRTLAGWTALLEELGFRVETWPMHAGTPYANTLLAARVPAPSS